MKIILRLEKEPAIWDWLNRKRREGYTKQGLIVAVLKQAMTRKETA